MSQPHAIFFLSYDEENAEQNWLALRARFPRAQRVHGVRGILEAHRSCAELSPTPHFFVVDGDNEVLDFDFSAPNADPEGVHVWRCRNAVNDLVYGYGGIKLYSRKTFLGGKVRMRMDLATSAAQYKIEPALASVTRFNTSPFAAWRAGFRECAKLASQNIHGQNFAETAWRLEAWCSLGVDRAFGKMCILGARAGREYGYALRANQWALGRINDFSWLRTEFDGRFDGKTLRS